MSATHIGHLNCLGVSVGANTQNLSTNIVATQGGGRLASWLEISSNVLMYDHILVVGVSELNFPSGTIRFPSQYIRKNLRALLQ